MSVWETLSKIDVSEHIEKKGNLSYLSWAWAWGTLMEHYPDADWTVIPDVKHEDGTVMVNSLVRIECTARTMFLPVMDNRNNAIQNPDTRQISDARMRCLVKNLAIFGLGHYIYAGEDLPPSEPENPATEDQVEEIKRLLDTRQVPEPMHKKASMLLGSNISEGKAVSIINALSECPKREGA